MIVLLAVLVIIILLLLYSVKIVYEVNLVNFDFFCKLEIKFPFTKEIYNSSKPKKKKSRAENKKEKQGGKFDLDKIKSLKNPATIILTEICKLIKKGCIVSQIEITAKTALEDPMENGIAYGIVSGVLNVISLILKGTYNVKKIKLEILSDFNSGEGLIFKSCGTLKIKPFILLINLIFARKLIKEIKNILEILKREENENG